MIRLRDFASTDKEESGQREVGCRHSTAYGSRVATSMTAIKEKRNPYQNRVELLQGTLDMLILQTLQWGPQHGYGISQAIRVRSGEVLRVETGSLYPALHRLERQAWVRSGWKLTESKQRAKYYRITATGKKQLVSDHGRWQQLVEAIGTIMSGELESGEP
jgi:PadR family transcriptional regulator PadR